MKIVFKAPAQQELDDTFTWYEEQLSGLGYRFVDAFSRTIDRIGRFPEGAALKANGARLALVSGFPYGVWYVCENETIVIYAVAHLQREPLYWADR